MSDRRKSLTPKVSKPKKTESDTIKVICRFRPPKSAEIKLHGQSSKLESFSLDLERGTVETNDTVEKRAFTFDKIFGIDAEQKEIFVEVQSIVDSVLAGYNGTILAYGQTSSGKTWTMEGPVLLDEDKQGMIPRAISQLFQFIYSADKATMFTVSVSYFEIYCEKLRDLLNPQQDNMTIRETKDSSCSIPELTEVFCGSYDNVMQVIETGKAHRASAPTLMNAESSRSHSIVTILVTQKNEVAGFNRKGKLYLVDLAGSEKVSKTGATGSRLEEAKNINRSLTTLGMVINALCEGSSHVSYRDSKLTRILMDSLGGNSKTTLIICCAPEVRHMAETLSTLRFGERAKIIKNNVRVNEELGVGEYKVLLDLAKKEIESLKAMHSEKVGFLTTVDSTDSLRAASDSSEVDADSKSIGGCVDTEELVKQLEVANETISQQSSRITELEEEIENITIRSQVDANEKITLAAENTALKMTVQGLEERLLKSTLIEKSPPQSPSNKADATFFLPEQEDIVQGEDDDARCTPSLSLSLLHTPVQQRDESFSSDSAEVPKQDESATSVSYEIPEGNIYSVEDRDGDRENSAIGSPIEMDATLESMDRAGAAISLETLEQESEELRQQLDTEALNMSLDSLNMDLQSGVGVAAESNRQAQERQTDVKFASKFARLKNDYDTHVRRLLTKLAKEQMARSQAEDELEQTLQTMWRKDESIQQGQKRGILGKIFGKSSDSSEVPSARERQFTKDIAQLNSRLSQQSSQYEAMKEGHRIVLETKESVVRSLLKQNTELSLEKSALNQRVDSLTDTVEHLTDLLRRLQTRTAPNPSLQRSPGIQGGGGAVDSSS